MEWNKAIVDKIEAAGDSVSLLRIGADIWKLRHFKDVMKYPVERLRKKVATFNLKQPVVAFDYNNIAHQRWYVGRSDESLKSNVREAYKAVSPGHAIFCSDTFRKESSREPKPQAFYDQMERVKEYLISKGMQWECAEGREADDILASIAFTCQIADLECVLVTNDSDLYQVLGHKTVIYDKGYKSAGWLKASTGLTAKQWPDYLTLVDECERFGKKTATSYLKAYGDVDGIHKHIDELKPSERAGFEKFWPNYLSLRRKHFIERDIPVGWEN